MSEDEKIIPMPSGEKNEEPDELESEDVDTEDVEEKEEAPTRRGGSIFLMQTIHGAIRRAVNEFDIGPMSILGVLEAVKHDICIAVAKGVEATRRENEEKLPKEEEEASE